MTTTFKTLKRNLLLLFLANSGSLATYLFQFLSARVMSPVDYGLFNSINSLGVLVSAPVPVLSLLITKVVVKLSIQDLGLVRSFYRRSLFYFFFIGAAILLLGLGASPFLKSYFHLLNIVPLFIIFCQLALGAIVPLPLGVLRGIKEYVAFTFSAASAVWIRLLAAVAIVLVAGALSVSQAIFCGVVGAASVFLLCHIFLDRRLSGERRKGTLDAGWIKKELRRSLVPVALTYMGLSSFCNIDLILVRHYLPGEAGLYAVAAILGRIGFYLPGILIAVLFPEALHAIEQKRDSNGILVRIVVLTALVSGCFALFCFLMPDFIIKSLMGAKYLAASSFLPIIAGAMAMLALAHALFTYGMAKERYGYLWALAGGVLLCVILVSGFFHNSAREVALAVFWSITSVLLGTAGWWSLTSGQRVK